jgi:pilus assembly protein CpaC
MTPEKHQQPVARRSARVWTLLAFAAALLLCAGAARGQEQDAPRPNTPRPATAPTQPAGRGAAAIVENGGKDGVIHLVANRSTVVKTRVPYKNVSISQPEVADVNLVGPQDILVTAKRPGNTQLIIWDDQDRSQVLEISVGFDLQALQEQFTRIFPDSKIEVSSLNGTIALRGRVPNLQVADQAEQVALPFGEKVLNFLEVSGGQQIMLQIRFAEISRSASTSLGFNAFGTDGRSRFGWNNGPGGEPIGGLASGASDVAINPAVSLFGAGRMHQTSFEYFISALRRNNLLRVLAEPNLVVYSGAQGSFLAGGEFPVPVPQTGGGGGGNTAITVEYKQFGVRLDFMPVVLGDGRIRLKVTPEVSDLDFSRSVSFNGFVIPSITKRTLTTEIELAEGQTFAVAGLLNNRVTANKDVTPLLGDLPILGALFRSVRYERNESELVVLVTPRLVEAMNPDQVPGMPGERWRYPSEGELLWNADLGGPGDDATVATPPAGRPARFRGEYGFTPVK